MKYKYFHDRQTGICAVLLSISLFPCIVSAEIIDSYLGMNFVNSTASVPEVQLQKITYIGAGGASITVTIPELPGNSPYDGTPLTGLPDGLGLTAAPTYTTMNGGDGETTRSFDKAVAIDWDASGDTLTIQITDIEVNVPGIGVWTAQFATPHTVGLIPKTGLDTELDCSFAAPHGDIYDDLVSAPGNEVGTVIATTAPSGYESLIGTAFGQFIFSAAWAADPVQKLGELVTDVIDVDAKQGVTTSLDKKLEASIGAIENVKQNNKGGVGGKLEAFINEVEAQSDKEIPKEKAEKLKKKAEIIRCSGGYGYGYRYPDGYGYGHYGYGGHGCYYGYGY